MFYTSPITANSYMINLLDTPGHADFSSELLRSLLPSQGALLLVDAAQGIQAQTLSVLGSAKERGLKVIGAVNKWDLVREDTRGPAAVKELAELLEIENEGEILKISAKTGEGVESVLEALVESIPAPKEGGEGEKLRAMVFDNWFDSFRGVVSLIAVVEGQLKKGEGLDFVPALIWACSSFFCAEANNEPRWVRFRRFNHVNNDQIVLHDIGFRNYVAQGNIYCQSPYQSGEDIEERNGRIYRLRYERRYRWCVTIPASSTVICPLIKVVWPSISW